MFTKFSLFNLLASATEELIRASQFDASGLLLKLLPADQFKIFERLAWNQYEQLTSDQ